MTQNTIEAAAVLLGVHPSRLREALKTAGPTAPEAKLITAKAPAKVPPKTPLQMAEILAAAAVRAGAKAIEARAAADSAAAADEAVRVAEVAMSQATKRN